MMYFEWILFVHSSAEKPESTRSGSDLHYSANTDRISDKHS